MQSFSGKCHGGPHDGQMLAHTSKRKTFYRPMMEFSLNEDVPIEAVEIGTYHLNDFGQWHWHATAAGRAMDVLYGEPTRET